MKKFIKEEGDHKVVCIKSEARLSKKGDPMLVLTFADSDNREVCGYYVPKHAGMVRSLARYVASVRPTIQPSQVEAAVASCMKEETPEAVCRTLAEKFSQFRGTELIVTLKRENPESDFVNITSYRGATEESF